MKFMIMIKSKENIGPPPKALMDAIANAGEEAMKAGTLVQIGGLGPTAMASREAWEMHRPAWDPLRPM